MKNLYAELSRVLGDAPVIELKEYVKVKELKATLLLKMGSYSALSSDYLFSDKPEVNDKRIKVLVADADSFSKLEPAVRILKTYIPDVKIFAAAPDMNNIPQICTGVLLTDPVGAKFALKTLEQAEGISFSSTDDTDAADTALLQAGGAIYAAAELAKKPEYSGCNILVYLP